LCDVTTEEIAPMFHPRQVATLFAVLLFGTLVFGISPRDRETREAPTSVIIETGVAEGKLAEISANGARFTLMDDIPEAQLKLRRLFNLTDDPSTSKPAMREFILSSRVPDIVDQFKPGQVLRVHYRIGVEPCVAVQVEACPRIERVSDDAAAVEIANHKKGMESKLAREIRWNLNEDNRLSVQSRLIRVLHDRRGVVLEGSVPNELEKMMVEEKVQRMTGGNAVLSKLRVEANADFDDSPSL